MQIILLKKVENLGNLGDKVTVKPGYGRNYLIPTGRAVVATAANLQEFDRRRTELEREAIALLTEAEARKTKLSNFKITLARRTAEEGRLYGSVSKADIAVALQTAGHHVDKHQVRIAAPLRVIGEHDVPLHLYSGIDVVIKVEIIPDE
jgi:large subunit ribosomal protein L9